MISQEAESDAQDRSLLMPTIQSLLNSQGYTTRTITASACPQPPAQCARAQYAPAQRSARICHLTSGNGYYVIDWFGAAGECDLYRQGMKGRRCPAVVDSAAGCGA